MIKVNKIQQQTVECFDNENNSLGFLNEAEFNDLRIQIAKEKAFGYYCKYNNEEVFILENGKIKDWPCGLFDTLSNQLSDLFIVQYNQDKKIDSQVEEQENYDEYSDYDFPCGY